MATIDLESKDYVLLSLDAAFVNDDVQCVCQRLGIHRGKYWANPKIGSRLFTLNRSKDLPRNLLLAKQYAEEALAWMKSDGIARDIQATSEIVFPARLNLIIRYLPPDGDWQEFKFFWLWRQLNNAI